ncbi:divergent polysaccharide deacetylase family protein [Lutispora sp.]|uniref:divergent polysaccharide deacetylase family protein n=1 Tax=Lutispora sp. TaxID=2828727 RepID=UPI000ED46550|nr:divergent polysaccharide deacetylase family protein [Lutispora sp.]MEA4961520.1 divergent polysaccharide deacetylase family protein [Lutispora sp.]HCJ56599.1 divergent polysaccharide deacetylase family protein [Clostridiaceae bacterium]
MSAKFYVIKKSKLFIGLMILLIAATTILGSSMIRVKSADIEKPKGYIAIIIDDFGNNGKGTNTMMNLGIPITAAIMPFLDSSVKDAETAKEKGLEIMLHMPMEPISGKPSWLGPGAIKCAMTDQEIQLNINDALDQLKWAVGMNNHMGSKVCQDRRTMEAILLTAKSRGIYFVDSKTAEKSVIEEVAKELDVPYFIRDVFLDSTKNQKEVEVQLMTLANIALRKGYAIGIGHVGPEGGEITAKAIKKMYPKISEKGVKFVFVSDIFDIVDQMKSDGK